MQPGPSNDSPDDSPNKPYKTMPAEGHQHQTPTAPSTCPPGASLWHHLVAIAGAAKFPLPANSSSSVVTDPPQMPYRTSMAWNRAGMRNSTCPPVTASPAEPCTAGHLKHATTSMRAASISRFLQQTKPAPCQAGPPVALHQADQPHQECDVHAPSSGAVEPPANSVAIAGQQADMPHYRSRMRKTGDTPLHRHRHMAAMLVQHSMMLLPILHLHSCLPLQLLTLPARYVPQLACAHNSCFAHARHVTHVQGYVQATRPVRSCSTHSPA